MIPEKKGNKQDEPYRHPQLSARNQLSKLVQGGRARTESGNPVDLTRQKKYTEARVARIYGAELQRGGKDFQY